MRSWLSGIAWLVAAAGCSTPVPVAATPDGGIVPPAAPTQVTHVDRTCPDDWLASSLSRGGQTCVPWIEPPHCADGQLLVAGTGCVPLATHCDADFAADAPADAVFVRPGSTGGDGTRAHPYATIVEAVHAGATVLALAAGEHVVAGAQLDGVTLLGACSDTTTIRLGATLILTGSGSRIARVRIRGAVTGIPLWTSITVSRGGALVLEEVELSGGISRALQLDAGASLDARRIAARDLGELFLMAQDPVRITLDHVGVERATGGGVLVAHTTAVPAGEIVATDVAIDETRLGSDPAAPGRGVWMIDRLESVALTRVVVDGAMQPGLLDRGGHLTLSDVFARGTQTVAIGLTDAQAEIAGATLDGAVGAGALFGTSTVTASELVVRGSDDPLLLYQSSSTLERVAIETTRGGAIQCEGGTAHLRDVVVDGVVSNRVGGGFAMQLRDGASVDVQRLYVHDASYAAVGTFGASLDVEDVVVEDVQPVDGAGGFGLVAQAGSLAVRRASVARATTVGVVVIDGDATLSDLRVEDTRAIDDSFYGVGLAVRGDTMGRADVTLERGEIVGSLVWGVWVTGASATLTATDVRVVGTGTAGCAELWCQGEAGGSNLVVATGATTHVARFELSSALSAGVLLGDDVGVSLSDGAIALNAIGIVVAPGLPINVGGEPGLTLHGVTLVGNMVDQQTTDIDVMAPPPEVLSGAP